MFYLFWFDSVKREYINSGGVDCLIFVISCCFGFKFGLVVCEYGMG